MAHTLQKQFKTKKLQDRQNIIKGNIYRLVEYTMNFKYKKVLGTEGRSQQ